MPAPAMGRGATWGLALGALVQALSIATLHGVEAPSITSLPTVLVLSTWMAVLFALLLASKVRLPGIAAVVGLLAFLSVFVASIGWDPRPDGDAAVTGTWPHAHVLLAASGIALLGIAGLAGLTYLFEHRRLKAKPPVPASVPLPSLEALDRVNVVTVAVGFVLLTLGILTGMVWLEQTQGMVWMGTAHEAWMVISWAIYAGLVAARFAGRQGARQAAASALAGFVFLLFGVVGVGAVS